MLTHRAELTAALVDRPEADLVWEETPCPLCSRDEADLLTEAADPLPAEGRGLIFAVVKCRCCGLAYTNPRPAGESISRFYPPEYSPHASPTPARRKGVPSRFWSRILGRPCPERRGSFPGLKPGRLLDFGCGSGSYLRRMAELGWRVTGLDVAPDVVRAVREELGYEALVGTLPHPDITPASFDVVTLWQALEHVHRPLATLREVLRVLVPGGTAVVAVPNFDSLPARWFGPRWFGLDLPRHLTHFTPATLTEMLRTAGFAVKSIRGLVHADWLRASAGRVLQAGEGGTGTQLLRWKAVARAVAWGCYAAGRAEALVAVAERPA